MTDHTDPENVRHDSAGTRAVPVAPDAAQAHARIVEALADPFAFAVALLGACGARSGRADLSKPMVQQPTTTSPAPRKEYRRKQPRTAEDILRPRDAMAGFTFPLSNKSKGDR